MVTVGLRSVFGGLAAALLLLSTTAGAEAPSTSSASATPAENSEAWYKATSDNFIVYSDRPRDETLRRVKALEIYRRFVINLMLPTVDSEGEQKLIVYLVDNPRWLKMVDSRNIGGVYFACSEGVTAFSADIDNPFLKRLRLAPSLPKQDGGQVVLFHEYTHHLMYRNSNATYPKWFIEGLADYLSTTTFEGRTANVGDAPYQDNWLLGQVNWGQFDRVLAPDKNLSSGLATVEGADPAIFYAKGWILTHYMLSDSQRAKSLEAYFGRLRAGENPITAFKTATGIDPYSELPGRLRAYSRAMPYSNYALPDAPDAKVDIAPMDHSDNAYVLMAGALQTCQSKPMGEWILKALKGQSDATALASEESADHSKGSRAMWERLKQQAPELAADPDYRMAVAYGEIQYGDPKAAITFLDTIGAGAALYPRAQYLLGRAWLALSDQATDAEKLTDRTKAAAFLEKAYAANPDDAPTLHFLARSYEGGADFPNDNALNAALQAADAAPSVYDYASYAAWLELLKGNRDDALALLKPFAEDPHAPERATAVAGLVDAIVAGKSAAEVKAMMDTLDQPKAKTS